MNKKPSIAIVILNWNGKNFLEKFLPSVLVSTYENKRIIVADNCSTDNSIEFLKTNFPSVNIIKNSGNFGFAKGYNEALKKIESEYYILLNSDVEVTPNWIEPIIELMNSDKSIAACQPKILSYSKKNEFEYAGASGGFIDYLGYPFMRGRIFETCEIDTGQYNDTKQCFWASGAALFVRAKAYWEMNGLDEFFFAHQEEIDLCWRMQLSGYKIFVEPKSIVYHVGGGTLPKGSNKKTFLNFRNNLIMLAKNLAPRKKVPIIIFRMILDGVSAVKELISGDVGFFISVIKAHLHFYKWILFDRKHSIFPQKKDGKVIGIYEKSIIFKYFIQKKKSFLEIIDNK